MIEMQQIRVLVENNNKC